MEASQVALVVKNRPANTGPAKTCEFDLWIRKIPWRREWHSTTGLLPRKSHGQRSLAGCSPWGHQELDMTERLSTVDKIERWKTEQQRSQAGNTGVAKWRCGWVASWIGIDRRRYNLLEGNQGLGRKQYAQE